MAEICCVSCSIIKPAEENGAEDYNIDSEGFGTLGRAFVTVDRAFANVNRGFVSVERAS
ncbi:hypothetical protein QIS74_06088 [Colletotrichum tabaci]|uniref:Uncharacterized protein n=1 Tax=Colletotrichum tabaci TaxID=1209068 RepID=A0AAV9TF94_9PEZI